MTDRMTSMFASITLLPVSCPLLVKMGTYLSILLFFLLVPAISFAESVAVNNGEGTDAEGVKEHLEFVTDFGANCVSRNAKQILIQNLHPSRLIKVKLFRYFGDVRQPGRASYTLAPGDEPLALGCDMIQGRAQRWDIHKAEFE